MWIKICGITSLKDAELAVAAGADAVGFVFAQSPRRVTLERVREITQNLPSSIEKIGVFVGAAPETIVEIHRIAGLTGVQLHQEGQNRLGDFSRLKNVLGHERNLRVVRYDGNVERFPLELRSLGTNPEAGQAQDAILVDTCIADKQGGTGVAFDWRSAQESFRRYASDLRLIVAGGLTPENVGDAIRTLQPWGVDVSSGVESAPGKKDPERIAAFIRAARAAEMELALESATPAILNL